MPEPRFQLKFKPNSQAALNQVRTFIENRLTGAGVQVRWRDFDWSGDLREGFTLSLRVPNRQAAENLIDFVRDNIAQLASRGTGVVNFHLCSHDDATVFSCKDDPRAFYREHRF